MTILSLLKGDSNSRQFGLFLAKKIEDRGYSAIQNFEKDIIKLDGSYSIGGISFSISNKEIDENNLKYYLKILGLK